MRAVGGPLAKPWAGLGGWATDAARAARGALCRRGKGDDSGQSCGARQTARRRGGPGILSCRRGQRSSRGACFRASRCKYPSTLPRKTSAGRPRPADPGKATASAKRRHVLRRGAQVVAGASDVHRWGDDRRRRPQGNARGHGTIKEGAGSSPGGGGCPNFLRVVLPAPSAGGLWLLLLLSLRDSSSSPTPLTGLGYGKALSLPQRFHSGFHSASQLGVPFGMEDILEMGDLRQPNHWTTRWAIGVDFPPRPGVPGMACPRHPSSPEAASVCSWPSRKGRRRLLAGRWFPATSWPSQRSRHPGSSDRTSPSFFALC
jgi:hypothetical protein